MCEGGRRWVIREKGTEAEKKEECEKGGEGSLRVARAIKGKNPWLARVWLSEARSAAACARERENGGAGSGAFEPCSDGGAAQA